MFVIISKANNTVSVMDTLPSVMEGDVYESLELQPDQSTLGCRYAIKEDNIVDLFPDLTDDEVIAHLQKQEQDSAIELAKINAPVKPVVLTKLTFMKRFSLNELAAVYTAAKTEVIVQVFLDKLKLAEDINLDDPDTIEGIQTLVSFGFLTETRAAEILTK